MPLDPDVAAQVAHLFDATLGQVLSGEVAGAPAARAMRRRDIETTDRVAGDAGPPVRVYRPAGAPRDLPALVWAHGGGWQFGGLDMPEADSVAQVVAATLPAVVVSVDYRLAPAHPHPAGLHDVVAAHRWATGAGADLGLDPGRVALGGASAGAHLCIGAAATLRDGGGPMPAALLLAYPVTDPVRGPYPEDRQPDCPALLWLDRDAVVGLFAGLVGDVTDPPRSAVPADLDLAGLPPTLLTTAECDALTPQVHHFAMRAAAAGVPVTVHDVEGLLHGYLNTVGDSAPADRALLRHAAWLRTALSADPPASNVGITPQNY